MDDQYLLLKSLHILGVIIFLGNIIITAYWKILADLSRNWSIISFAQRLVTYTDIIFTLTGVVLILTTGLMLANYYEDFYKIKWIRRGLELFSLSGMIWVFILIPIQIYLHKLTYRIEPYNQISKQYWKYEVIWMICGLIATLLPIFNLYLMVFKPL